MCPMCACHSSGVGHRRRSSSASARCARRGEVRPHAVENASVVSGTAIRAGVGGGESGADKKMEEVNSAKSG